MKTLKERKKDNAAKVMKQKRKILQTKVTPAPPTIMVVESASKASTEAINPN